MSSSLGSAAPSRFSAAAASSYSSGSAAPSRFSAAAASSSSPRELNSTSSGRVVVAMHSALQTALSDLRFTGAFTTVHCWDRWVNPGIVFLPQRDMPGPVIAKESSETTKTTEKSAHSGKSDEKSPNKSDENKPNEKSPHPPTAPNPQQSTSLDAKIKVAAAANASTASAVAPLTTAATTPSKSGGNSPSLFVPIGGNHVPAQYDLKLPVKETDLFMYLRLFMKIAPKNCCVHPPKLVIENPAWTNDVRSNASPHTLNWILMLCVCSLCI